MAKTGLSAKAAVKIHGQSTTRVVNVFNVLEYEIDSALDTDADSWSISIGDFDHDLIATLSRDIEVEMNIFVVGQSSLAPLHRGFADEIGLDQESKLIFTGRDITAVATDSQANPESWSNVRPSDIVAKQARELKIGDRLKLSPTNPFKHLNTDGSESYWEFWYRLYRKRSKWMWAEADGTIFADYLNYNNPATYFFGEPRDSRTSRWIKVETALWKKSTTSRIGEVFIFGHRGDTPFIGQAQDTSIQHWIKKPRKILQDSHAYNQNEARISALEEIFESKVGALEWVLMIADPGFIVRQNTMAEVNLPSIGLRGRFFVVGAQTIGGSQGLFQVVRLRERNFAASKRIPPDPEAPESPIGTIASGLGYPGTQLANEVRWAECFSRAAYKHHGPWDFSLFLSALMAISFCGEGGRNVREGGSTEYYTQPSPLLDPEGYRRHHELFANDPGTPGNPFLRDAGVGPMQLTTNSYKVAADKIYNPNIVDEFVGGRWWPCANIEEGAIVLREKLQATGAETRPDNDPESGNIWLGVKAYNGSGPAADTYLARVKACALDTYLPIIQAGLTSARQAEKQQPASSAVFKCVNAPYLSFENRVSSPTDGLYAMMSWLEENAGVQGDPSINYSGHGSGGGISYHYSGQAIDIGDATNSIDNLIRAWNLLFPLRLNLAQLIWAPTSIAVQQQAPNTPGGYFCGVSGGYSDHTDHIHVAYTGTAAQWAEIVGRFSVSQNIQQP
jgi:hypothetical protein